MSDSYELHPDFENLVVYFAAANRDFWSAIGRHLETDLFSGPLAKPIVEAARLVAKDGVASSSPTIVLQRLQAKVVEGKLTQDTLLACSDFFDKCEDDGLPAVELVIQEMLPVIRSRLQSKAILAAHGDFAKGGDMAVTRGLLDQAQKLGQVDVTASYNVKASGFHIISNASDVVRIPTGIPDLDIALGGGATRGSLGVWLADTGGGKSIALIHGAAEVMRQQMFCGFVTLELPADMQSARLLANLTGVDFELIMLNDVWRAEAERRFTLISSQLGHCELAEFSPQGTTVDDILEWVNETEEKYGVPMSSLFVDYADDLVSPSVRADNLYLAMRDVYGGLRKKIAHPKKMVVWTASQATRPKDKKAILGVGNVADSMHKMRAADLGISINHDDESQLMSLFLAKNRTGKSKFLVGPLVPDFAKGRLCTLPRELGKW